MKEGGGSLLVFLQPGEQSWDWSSSGRVGQVAYRRDNIFPSTKSDVNPPELPAMSMCEYFSGWLLFAWCLSNPATLEEVLKKLGLLRRNVWLYPNMTCIKKAAGYWCPRGVLLLGALWHCSTDTNSPDLSWKRNRSKFCENNDEILLVTISSFR